MSDLERIEVAQFFIALGVLLFGLFYMRKRTRVDELREELFTIRDELFDYMWQHGLSYKLPVYQLMRDALNGAIRVSGQLTVPNICAALYVFRNKRQAGNPLRMAIEEISNPEVRAHFNKVYGGMAHILVIYLAFTPLGFILIAKMLARHAWHDYSTRYSLVTRELSLIGQKNSPEARFFMNHLRGSYSR